MATGDANWWQDVVRSGRSRPGAAGAAPKTARQRAACARWERERRIDDLRPRLAEKRWALALARQDFVAYRQVTFASYLKRILLLQG